MVVETGLAEAKELGITESPFFKHSGGDVATTSPTAIVDAEIERLPFAAVSRAFGSADYHDEQH